MTAYEGEVRNSFALRKRLSCVVCGNGGDEHLRRRRRDEEPTGRKKVIAALKFLRRRQFRDEIANFTFCSRPSDAVILPGLPGTVPGASREIVATAATRNDF